RAVDDFVHHNRDMVICFAAGNDGIDSNQNAVIDNGSVSPPGTAKHCITVGASESQRAGSRTARSSRPSWHPKEPLTPQPIAASVTVHDEGDPLADSGDSVAFQVQAGPSGRLKVTLVWTDPPGLGLQNDLDLIVTCDGLIAHGNKGVGATTFDRDNNVEQVDW